MTIPRKRSVPKSHVPSMVTAPTTTMFMKHAATMNAAQLIVLTDVTVPINMSVTTKAATCANQSTAPTTATVPANIDATERLTPVKKSIA